ncbi:MAG: hypothetical protein RDO_0110 [Flavobacteriales endosymbiont of Rhyzopertha dominica]|nr:MAG: valine--tRNA ligase [Candidatus Shikimatogenerans bostrichidophilus]
MRLKYYKKNKNYNFNKYDKIIYKNWNLKKYFFSKINKNKKSINLLLPPPNITGDLHIGHILNFTILDIFARRYRMLGYNVCFIPGTDHASIATEIKIIKILKNKGIKINKISKNKFNKIILKWSKKYNKIIINQLKSIGCSCDWKKKYFTMDKNHYKSVIKVFIKLYKEGIIYKDNKIVNWDIYAKTTISEEEVIYKNEKKDLYYIKYYTKNKKNNIVISTTRPETIFGDTAICVNNRDKRYKLFRNKKFIIPIINRKIPLIKNTLVNKKFGSGCIKITPAHSEKDYIIFKKNKEKYNLKLINILNDDGTLNNKCMNFSGKDRFLVRKSIIKTLKKLGNFVKKKKILSKNAYSERTNTIIEKKISLQWFLKIKKIVKNIKKYINKIIFYPKNKYNNLIYKWIKNIKDWNISRQLNWGHKIPVYYYKNKEVVANNYKIAKKLFKKKYNIKKKDFKIKQENNVLDTWFSSWILPISVLNGINNNNNKNFNYYYPIKILVTGNDILFFWVLRMIIFSGYYINKIPFKKVYFTGIARDINNNKISKSLGNYKNLYYLLKKYGADGLRVGLLSINNEYDFIYNEKLCEKGRNFINKIWNSLKYLKKIKIKKKNNKNKKLNKIIIKWFNNYLIYKINKLNIYIKEYKIYKSFLLIYNLFKEKFCSIYLELIKNNINKIILKKTLKYYKLLLLILHPYIPFVTEYIYNILYKKNKNNKDITVLKFPIIKKKYKKNIIKKFKNTLEFIKYLKKINFIKKNKKRFNLYIYKKEELLYKKKIYFILIYKLSLIKKIKIINKKKNKKKYLFYIFKNFNFFIKKKNIINNLNKKKIYIKIKFYENYLYKIIKKLKNKKFLLLAPKNIINLEKKKKKNIKKLLFTLKNNYKL